MFEYYEKLFPPELRYTQYKDDKEHIADRIKFLDMKICDFLIDEKENEDNSDLIDTLLKKYDLSEEKMHNKEKKNRIRILNLLKEYINDREEASKYKMIDLTLVRVEKTFLMDEFVKMCLTMSIACEINKKYSPIYTFINNGNSIEYPNPYIALKICGVTTENYKEIIPCIALLKTLKDYIFKEKSSVIEDKNDINKVLKLSKRVQEVLFNENNKNSFTYYFNIYKCDESLNQLLFDEDIKSEILKSVSSKVDDVKYNLNKKADVVILTGGEGVGKKFQIKHAIKELRKNVLFIDLDIVLLKKDDVEALTKQILQECLLQNVIPCLCGLEKIYTLEHESNYTIYSILMELKKITPLIFITSKEGIREKNYIEYFNFREINVKSQSLSVRTTYLKDYIKKNNFILETDIEILLNKFAFTLGQIDFALKEVEYRLNIDNTNVITQDLIYDIFNNLAFNKLSDLATPVKPSYTLDDLVLKKDQKDILEQACNQIKYKHVVYEEWGFNEKRAYGKGTCVLFTGSPGTGKTMAAQVLANTLKINMYKVDLSQIVSKYIGETEKNLKKLFDEAKKSNALLFFDEADTIFGKRTEVKDSHDKYANMDAAYLLQKIEEYEGISVLATNYIQNIDDAFIRRITFIIRFSMPEFNERKEIWKRVFPDKIPIDRAIDYDFLASKFELSGSNIKNIALHSAFLAASNNEGINMKHIINAIKTQYLKVNKILLKEDLGPYFT